MATRRCLIGAATIVFFSLAITIPAVSAAAPPLVIKKHIVGEAVGWSFDLSTNTASANYLKWAASQTFYLGEWISFYSRNTNSFSVVQTNNETKYNLCDASYDDYDNQTIIWSSIGDDSNSSTPTPQGMDIPLTDEGPIYFFSDTNRDRQECLNGMKFGINVLHGNGGGGPSQDQSSGKSGVEGMQGGMVWTGLVLLSLGLMAL